MPTPPHRPALALLTIGGPVPQPPSSQSPHGASPVFSASPQPTDPNTLTSPPETHRHPPACVTLPARLSLTRAAALLLLASAALAQVPTPESVLGHKPGDDFYLASYDESLNYFRKLAQATDKLKLVRVGKTSHGRDWYIASSPPPRISPTSTSTRTPRSRLALVKGLTDAQAHALAHNGKVIVHIDGGLHATEVAAAQHTIQLAYNLVTGTDPETAAILDNVILLLWFSINPDGQNMVAYVVSRQPRHALRSQPTAGALPGVHRAR